MYSSDDFRSNALGMNKTPKGRIIHMGNGAYKWRHIYQAEQEDFVAQEDGSYKKEMRTYIGQLIWNAVANPKPTLIMDDGTTIRIRGWNRLKEYTGPRCPHCNSTDLQMRIGWVNLQTGNLVDIDWQGSQNAKAWCQGCREEVEYEGQVKNRRY